MRLSGRRGGSAESGAAAPATPADRQRMLAVLRLELAIAERTLDDGMGGELLPGAGHHLVQRRPTARTVEE